MKYRVLSIILSLAMVLTLLPAAALTAAAADAGATEISTAAQLPAIFPLPEGISPVLQDKMEWIQIEAVR